MTSAPWIVSDELWELIEPLLPKVERRFRYPGRKRLPDRQALQGILFVLHTGISWPHLPLELGFGSAATTPTRCAINYATAASDPRSPTATTDTAPDSAAPAGSSNAPSPGSTTSNGCSSATTTAQRSTRLPRHRLLPLLLQEAPTLIVIRVLRALWRAIRRASPRRKRLCQHPPLISRRAFRGGPRLGRAVRAFCSQAHPNPNLRPPA